MNGNRAVAYARYSSNNQREESIEEQLMKIQDYADRNHIEIINQYTDYAKSGSKNIEKRESFLKMIDDIENGNIKVDYVIVYCLSRFMRNTYESAIYKKKLKNKNVRLISVTENLNDTPESIILEGVLDAINEYYSLNLSQETMRGLMFNARNALHAGGFPPLGYKIVDKKYVVNEDERPIVEIVFNRYAEGVSLDRIVKELNDLGYRTRKGNQFKASSLYDLLENEKVTGTYIYNKREGNNFTGKKNSHKYKEDDEIVRIPNAFEGIISQELFDKVQDIRAGRKHSGGRVNAKENYLLSGLIYCGECQARDNGELYSFTGNRRVYKDKPKYVSYRCSQRKYQCINKEIRKEYIENYVLDELRDKIFTEKGIRYVVSGVNRNIAKRNEQNMSQITILEKNIADLDRQVSNIIQAIKNGIFDESFSKELETLREKKGLLVNRIDEIKSSTKTIGPVDNEMIKNMIGDFRKYILERNTSECKKFLHSFVDRIIVYRDRVEVQFRISLAFLEGLEFNDTSTISRTELEIRYKGKYYGSTSQKMITYKKNMIERV